MNIKYFNQFKVSIGFIMAVFLLISSLSVQASRQLAANVVGDSSTDLISINSLNQLQISSGDGDGTFDLPLTVPLNFNPVEISLNDFDQDGFLDLLALDTNGVLSLSLNNQANGFDAETILSLGLVALEGVADLKAGLINGDDTVDIAVVVNGLLNGRVVILPGDGAGGFSSPIEIEMTSLLALSQSIDIADLNTNGFVDLIVKDIVGTVHLLLSDGLGDYQAPSTIAGVLPTGGIFFNDFNNDQIPDMVVLDEVLGLLTIRLGNGDGSFQSGVAVAVGITPVDLVAVDLNTDGNRDLAVVNVGDNSISVLIGDGLGGVIELVGQALEDLLGIVPILNLPIAVVSDDFNLDCRLDMAMWNESTDSYVLTVNQAGPDLAELVFCSTFDY